MNKIFLLLASFFLLQNCYAQNFSDEVADALPRNVESAAVYKDYDYTSTIKVPIRLKIKEDIKSEKELYEGQIIDFKVTKDVLFNGKTIVKRGAVVPARVSVIISPGMNGIPASIIIDKFSIEGISKTQLTASYEIFGQDRSLLVLPLKWALTPIPPTGSLTNFIKGGHVKIKAKKPIEIYYYPEWK